MVVLLPGMGCKKFLEEKPFSTIDPNGFFKDQNDVLTWQAGVYNAMQTALTENFFQWGDVRGDNFEVGGVGNAQLKMVSNTLSANDNDLNNITRWNNLYQVISLCNYGIKYIPPMIEANVGGGAPFYRDVLGQCYALRALMYFYGLRVWGRMPLHIEPIEASTQTLALPRATIEQMRTQLYADITESLRFIGSATSQKFYMQRGAVFALQTDVAMWFQDYNLALSASQNCITSSGCTWVTNVNAFKNIFIAPETSTETIFNMFWSFQERGTAMRACALLGSSASNALYNPTTAAFVELRDRIDTVTGRTIDGRFWAYYDTLFYSSVAAFNGDQFRQLGKFSPWRPSPTPDNFFVFESILDCSTKIPIYRFADIMLLRAEALNRTGQPQQALDIVNTVRNRVGYNVRAVLSDYSGDITAGIESTILTERKIELMGEGKRWFDLCRIGRIYDYSNAGYGYLRETMNAVLTERRNRSSLYAGSLLFEGANMGRILFPINSIAFNNNPRLLGDQNPPYDE